MNKKHTPNEFIEEYLDYYCGLQEAPKLAILLKGKWGSGKTWFIKKYHDRLNKAEKIALYKSLSAIGKKLLNCIWRKKAVTKKKAATKINRCLYISLYGLNSISDIDESIYQQLHPFWSSERVKTVGIVIKSLLKGSLKIDLTQDNKDKLSINIQVPDIPKNFEYSNFKETNKRVLIFDDLERCNINIVELLGYINKFVEHQKLKVIIVADESKLEDKENYLNFKEKLIGRTFCVQPDFYGLISSHTDKISDLSLIKFISENTEFIKDIFYVRSECVNLRILDQILLDFERIFECLSLNSQNNTTLLKDILNFLVAFSIEISLVKIKSHHIVNLVREFQRQYIKSSIKAMNISTDSTPDEDKNNIQEIVKENFGLYSSFDFNEVFPSALWWERFFNEGYVNKDELKSKAIIKYFPQEQTKPNCQKLYYWRRLSNNEFENLLQEVISEYKNKKFTDIHELKFVVGIFLDLSNEGLYSASMKDIFNSAKDYVDHLNKNQLIPPGASKSKSETLYNNIDFLGKDFEEFEQLTSYINYMQDSVSKNLRNKNADELIDLMTTNVLKFHQMICVNNDIYSEYGSVPILMYANPNKFFDALKSIDPGKQTSVLASLSKRYRYIDSENKELLHEIEWLKNLQKILVQNSKEDEGTPDGYRYKKLNDDYLEKTIKLLESKRDKQN